MYDIKKLDEIKLTTICEAYGIALERKGKTLVGRLRSEDTPSFCIYDNNNRWVDFGTNEKGGSIKLIQKLEQVNWNMAIKILGDRFGGQEYFNNNTMPTKHQFEIIGINSERAIANFVIDLERQSLEKIEEWEKKYSISIYELSKTNINMYHKILDSKALPIIYDERKHFKKMQNIFPTLNSEVEKALYKDKLLSLEKSINYKVDIYNKARLDKMKKYYLKVKIDMDF
jgi:CHC2 zinc finger